MRLIKIVFSPHRAKEVNKMMHILIFCSKEYLSMKKFICLYLRTININIKGGKILLWTE